jgi:hypothetical protein
MKVYKCILSGDVLVSDAFKQQPIVWNDETLEGVFMVKSKLVAKGGADIDIGAGNAFGGGAEDEGPDDSVETVNNLVDADTGFNYLLLSYSKAELKADLKEWMKALRKKLKAKGTDPEILKTKFVPQATAFSNFLVKNFDNLEIYMPTSNQPVPEASLVIGYYEGEDSTPSFVFFEMGLEEEKY